jgi:hypothetical protein
MGTWKNKENLPAGKTVRLSYVPHGINQDEFYPVIEGHSE